MGRFLHEGFSEGEPNFGSISAVSLPKIILAQCPTVFKPPACMGRFPHKGSSRGSAASQIVLKTLILIVLASFEVLQLEQF